MRFSRWPYGERLSSVQEFERLAAEQAPEKAPAAALTLFPNDAAPSKPRSARWSSDAQYLRDQRARHWRDMRGLVFALPAYSRRIILEQWNGKSARILYAGSPAGFREFLKKNFPYLLA